MELVLRSDVVTFAPRPPANQQTRELIMAFEEELKKVPASQINDCLPLCHLFAPGVYCREIAIPAGTVLTGKIHKEKHLNYILIGRVHVFTEEGLQELRGPMNWVSEAGTKRTVVAIEDTVWCTVHHNPDNLTDLAKLEELIIAPSYEALEHYEKLKELS